MNLVINVEKYVVGLTFRGFNLLRGNLEIGMAEGTFRELFFLHLLNLSIEKEDYFKEKISGKIYMNNSKELFASLNKFIENNNFLEGIFDYLYTFKEEKDYRVLDGVLDILKDFKNVEGLDLSLAFRCFLDILFRSKRQDLSTTSPSIRSLIRELLREREIKEIYDPAIGYGSLSLEVASLHSKASIYGQDINCEVIKVCKMQFILDKRIGDLDNLTEGNTIINPGNVYENKLKKFDCVVCNPPYGVRGWGYEELLNKDDYNRFHRGMPSKSLGDYAFIIQAIESLKDCGIGVMVEPSGVLFREGAEGVLRTDIVLENLIDAIITLPNNMMYGTTIQGNLIIFNKHKKNEDIFFIDASREALPNKLLNTLSEESIEKIVKVYEERIEIEGFSRRVSLEEIKENNFNLITQRYVEEVMEKEYLDNEEIEKRIEELTERLKEIDLEINKFFKKE